MPAPARGRVIANVGRLFENNKEKLSQLVTREMGKVYAEALGEVQEVIDTCDFFLGEGRRLYCQTVPSEMPNKNLFTFRQPVGTALIITAGNFPAAVPSWYLVPALLTGNTVVWKPSSKTPLAAIAVQQICNRVLERHVAVKLLHEQYAADESAVERFRREFTEEHAGRLRIGREALVENEDAHGGADTLAVDYGDFNPSVALALAKHLAQ